MHAGTVDELQQALEKARQSEKPVLIEAECNDMCPPITDFVGNVTRLRRGGLTSPPRTVSTVKGASPCRTFVLSP